MTLKGCSRKIRLSRLEDSIEFEIIRISNLPQDEQKKPMERVKILCKEYWEITGQYYKTKRFINYDN